MSNMKTKLFDRVANVIQQLGFQKIIIVALASILLLTTTACNPNSPSVSGTGSIHERVGQPTGLREYTDRADSKNRPDMSSYSDNDYRATTTADSKARNLEKRADQNANKVNNPQDFAESYRTGKPLPERVRDLSEDVGDAAKQFGQDASKGTQENVRNLRANTEKAKQNAQETAGAVRDRA